MACLPARSEPEFAPSRAEQHVRLSMMAPVYVVHALGAAETAEFERHMSGCLPCGSEVTRLREIALVLSQAVVAAGKTPTSEIVARAARMER